MKNKKLYYLINIFFLILALGIVFCLRGKDFSFAFSIKQFLLLLILFLIIHIFKIIRIWFILLEEMVPIKQILKIYIKSTFVSIALPYKFGEIFKIYSYGYEIKNYSKGLLAVIIEKFFDAFILCLFLIPYGVYVNKHISSFAWLLLITLLIITAVYFSFKNTYFYLNKFLMLKINNKWCINALETLEKLNNLFDTAKSMINGRSIILLGLSGLSWAFEILLIFIMSKWKNIEVGFMTIANYFSDSFFGITNALFNNYIYLGTIILLIAVIIIYINKGWKICSKNYEKESEK